MQSLDFNSIENICNIILDWTCKYKISNRNEVKEKFVSEWARMEEHSYESHMKSMPKKPYEVKKCKRISKKY